MIRWGAIAGVLILAIACAPAEQQRSTAEDVAAIEQIRDAELQTLNAGDVEGYLALHSEDCITMPPDAPLLVGKAQVRAWMEGFLAASSLELESQSSEVAVAGDQAVEHYTVAATTTPKAGGEPLHEMSKGVHIYARQPDASWRIAYDVWNSDTDAAADTAAIRGIFDRAAEAIKAGEVEPWLALFADGAIYLPPDQPAAVGTEGLTAFGRGAFDEFDWDLSFDIEEVEVAGPWAYTRQAVTGTSTPKAGGNPLPVDLKELSILRRGAEGTWKVWRGINNSNIAPADE